MIERVLKNTASSQKVLVYSNGALTDADGNAVAYSAVDANGTVVASGSAVHDSTGIYSFTLAAQSQVKQLTITWTGAISGVAFSLVTHVEVVGNYYFTIAELRALPGLSDTSKYTNDELVDARMIAEVLFEDVTEQVWVLRYRREVHDGDDCTRLLLNETPARQLIAVKINGTAADTTGWTLTRSGRVLTDGDVFTSDTEGQNVIVEYVVGEDRPPEDLRRAALRYARHVLLTEQTVIPDRANLMTTEFATFRLATAGDRMPTGLPEVDAVLNRYTRELPVFA